MPLNPQVNRLSVPGDSVDHMQGVYGAGGTRFKHVFERVSTSSRACAHNQTCVRSDVRSIVAVKTGRLAPAARYQPVRAGVGAPGSMQAPRRRH